MQLMRMLAAQGGQPNELVRVYFREGPQRTLAEMQSFLASAMSRGQLREADALVAATQFFVLLKGVAHLQVMLGLREPPKDAELSAHIERGVDLFLAGHAPVP